MPRLRTLRDEELPERYRALLTGAPSEDVLRVFGHNMKLWEAWQGFYRPIMKDGAVPMRLKELMRLRVARLNECAV